jgi:hypothetical protein
MPDTAESRTKSKEDQLVSWVMDRVNRWRQVRDNAFSKRWGEYYRLWRGRWDAVDKNRSSERSRLIAPALSQAIEMTVAEMEEATFGREQWFDVRDDIVSKQQQPTASQMIQSRDRLLEDSANANIPDAISAAYLNGALYGNGIAKIVMQREKVRTPGPPGPNGQRKVVEKDQILFKLDPIPADEFVPDPAGQTIDEMLGCAHELLKPTAWVQRLQSRGIFRKTEVVKPGDGVESAHKQTRGDLENNTQADSVFITEYHGLVPAAFLPAKKSRPDSANFIDNLLEAEEIRTGDGESLVEAIVTISNKSQLLRASANPFWMRDRSIISYQHEKVPGRFWGRSVAEKGFNPQKALDAELRSRMDALALISNPMMAADLTRMPRGFDLRVRPGKLWLTNGAPKDVLQPVVFQGLDPSSFNQTGDLERMVQMGTGAVDTATPIRMNNKNSTATGSSLQQATFVKRSKRAMANVSRNFLQPIIKKLLWRYMQFNPQRYPIDVDFRVMGTLGIVARELEQNQLTQMLGLVPEGSPPQLVLIKSIFDNASSPYKDEMNRAVDSMLNPSEEQVAKQQLQEQLQQQVQLTELQKTKMETSKLQSEVILNIAKATEVQNDASIKNVQVEIEIQRLLKELDELQQLSRQNDAALINAQANLMKARSGGGNGNQSGGSTA